MEQKGTDFSLYEEYLNPSSGTQAQLPVLYEEYRFSSEDDIKTYLKLLPLVPILTRSLLLKNKKLPPGSLCPMPSVKV